MATKAPIKKRPPKTIKEKRFVKEYIKSGNGVQAALKAYDTTNYASANVIAQENLQKLSIDLVMDKAGLTDEVLVSSLSLGLFDAEKVDQYTGERTPDYSTRHRYLETALKLKKHLTPDKGGDSYTQVNNNYSIGWQ